MKVSARDLGVAMGATLVLTAGGLYSSFRPQGAADPIELVDRYLLALEQKDRLSIMQLIPASYSAEQAVQEKIAQWGGFKIENRQVFRTTTSPQAVRLKIYGTYLDKQNKRQPFEDTLNLVYQPSNLLPFSTGRWKLLLGKDPTAK